MTATTTKGFVVSSSIVFVFVVLFLFLYGTTIENNNGGSAEASSLVVNSVQIQLSYLAKSRRTFAESGRLWVKVWIIYNFGNGKIEGYPVSETKFQVKKGTKRRKPIYFVESDQKPVCDVYDKLRWVRDYGRTPADNNSGYQLELFIDNDSKGCAPIRPTDVSDLLGGIGHLNVNMKDIDPVFWEVKSVHSDVDIMDYDYDISYD